MRAVKQRKDALGVCCVQQKNDEARKLVQAGKIKVGGQTETLSQADKDQVQDHTLTVNKSIEWPKETDRSFYMQTVLLSNTFNLDEHKCVRLLMMAGQQVQQCYSTVVSLGCL